MVRSADLEIEMFSTLRVDIMLSDKETLESVLIMTVLASQETCIMKVAEVTGLLVEEKIVC